MFNVLNIIINKHKELIKKKMYIALFYIKKYFINFSLEF